MTRRLVTQSLAPDGTELEDDGSWLATRIFREVNVEEWDVKFVDEVAAATERKLIGWARAVGGPFDPPTDGQERYLGRRVLERKLRWLERKR